MPRDNPINKDSKSLLETLEREHKQALRSIQADYPKPAEMRYELILSTMVELCKELQRLDDTVHEQGLVIESLRKELARRRHE